MCEIMRVSYGYQKEVEAMFEAMGFTKGPNRYHEKPFGDGILEIRVVYESGGSWLPDEGIYVGIRIKGVTYQDQFVDVIDSHRKTFDEAFLRERVNAKLDWYRMQSRADLRAGLAKHEKIEGMKI